MDIINYSSDLYFQKFKSTKFVEICLEIYDFYKNICNTFSNFALIWQEYCLSFTDSKYA